MGALATSGPRHCPSTSSGDVLRLSRKRDCPGTAHGHRRGRGRPGPRARPAFWPAGGQDRAAEPACRQTHHRSPKEAQHRDTASAARGRTPTLRRNGKDLQDVPEGRAGRAAWSGGTCADHRSALSRSGRPGHPEGRSEAKEAHSVLTRPVERRLGHVQDLLVEALSASWGPKQQEIDHVFAHLSRFGAVLWSGISTGRRRVPTCCTYYLICTTCTSIRFTDSSRPWVYPFTDNRGLGSIRFTVGSLLN